MQHKIALYIRVSTEEQASNPEGSIKSQEHRLRDFIKLKNASENFGEVMGVYTDAGISGKDTNRPELQRLMADAKGKKINLILITELSRLTRSVKDFAILSEMLESLGCKVLSLKDNFDTTTAVGSFTMYLMANLAQFERKQISERISANFLSRAKRGLYNGGSVPLGYQASQDRPGHLEIIPAEAEQVREIFKAFLECGTLAAAAKALNQRKLQVTRSIQGGGKTRVGHILIETLYRFLSNKSYIGIREYKEKGKLCETKAAWEPIVNEEVFNRVQEILKTNKFKKTKEVKNRYPYLLSGFLYCNCGERLAGKSAHGNGGKIGYYDHAWRAKIQSTLTEKIYPCSPMRVQAAKLEPVVWGAAKDFLLKSEFFAEIILEAKSLSELDSPKKEIERFQNKVYGINQQLEALSERLGLLPKSVSPKHVFDQMEKLSLEKAEIETKLQFLKSKSAENRSPVEIEDFKTFRASIQNLLENEQNPETKTKIIQKIVHKIIVNSTGIEIWFHVGERHFKRELEITSSSQNPFQASEKRRTHPLPVFRGNPQTSNLLALREKNFHDAGSNSLKIGSEGRT